MRHRWFHRGVLALLLAVLTMVPGMAGPQGGNVVNGTATVTQQGNQTIIRQGSPQAIINWQSFNIGSGETVQFLQPNALAVTLNRVTGIDPSIILGSLLANGRIFLINPNGVLFGQGATVNVGSLVVSTLGLSDQDFLAGRLNFQQDVTRNLAFIVNQGSLTAANGGTILLVAPLVNNSGTLVANLGQVTLAAGTKAVVNLDPDGRMVVAVGSVNTNPGDVVLLPGANSDLLSLIVNSNKVVTAGGVRQCGSNVILTGSEGLAVNSGSIVTNGAAGHAAGEVQIVSTQASVSGPGSSIQANGSGATSDGGTIRILSSGAAVLSPSGSLSARGGCTGNGGFIEISGERVFPEGHVDATAAHGKKGTFLIDPTNLAIVDGAGTACGTLTGCNGVINCGNVAGCASVSVGTINAQSALSNISLTALGSITFQNNGNIVLAPNSSLSITATLGTIQVCGAHTGTIKAQGTGSVTFCAHRCINFTNAITTNSGTVCIHAANGCCVRITTGPITSTSGNINISSGGFGGQHPPQCPITINGAITTGGKVNITATCNGVCLHAPVQGKCVTIHLPTGSATPCAGAEGVLTFGNGIAAVNDGSIVATCKACLIGSFARQNNINATDITAAHVALQACNGFPGGAITTAAQDIKVTGTAQLVNTSATTTTLNQTTTHCNDVMCITQKGGGKLCVVTAGGAGGCTSVSITTQGGSDVSVGVITAPLGVTIVSSGSILATNACTSLITAGPSVLTAANVIGTGTAPLPVAITGTLKVAPSGQLCGVSVDVKGTISAGSLCVTNAPPGLTLFNQPAPPPPPPPPVPTPTPATTCTGTINFARCNPNGVLNQTQSGQFAATTTSASSSDNQQDTSITDLTAPPPTTTTTTAATTTGTNAAVNSTTTTTTTNVTNSSVSVLTSSAPDAEPLISISDDDDEKLRRKFRATFPRPDMQSHRAALTPNKARRDKRSLLQRLYEARQSLFSKYKH